MQDRYLQDTAHHVIYLTLKRTISVEYSPSNRLNTGRKLDEHLEVSSAFSVGTRFECAKNEAKQ